MASAATAVGPQAATDVVIRIDGTQPLSAAPVVALSAVCDRAEDRGEHGRVILRVSGAPGQDWTSGLAVALVSKWERALRRLEHLPAVTIAVVGGDCGGLALDALLATDYRIASASARLLVPSAAGTTWPGMALYRLVQQAGPAAVRGAALFGLPIEAGAARAMHLIDQVADDAESALAAVAAMTVALPGAELAIRRQLILDATTVSFEDALGVHLAACDRALRRVQAGTA